MAKYKGIIFTFVGIVAVIGLLWILQIAGKGNNPAPVSTNGILSAEESSFNFGNVSMAAGKVSHIFKIKNTGVEPLIIAKISTSCMCTEADLVRGGKTTGPFGMEGMGYTPTLDETLASNEEAEIKAVFDPAAHGPAGLGHIERLITVENSGKTLELVFTADVMP